MTAQQAIERANQMKAGNAVSDELKLEWLTELDKQIYDDCVLTHLHDFRYSRWWAMVDGVLTFQPAPDYTEDDTIELIAEENVYIYYLMTKIDLFSQEEHRYNVDNALFEAAYKKWVNKYHRNHTPVPNPPIKVGVFR